MRGLLVPVSGYPEILYDDLEKVKLLIFYNHEPSLSTFNSHCNYFHYNENDSKFKPINKIATFFKRMYTHSYKMTNVIRGDILVYSSYDNLPNVVDSSVPQYFIDQVITYYLNDSDVI